MATFSRRLTHKRPTFSAESMCLVVLLAASVMTAWYAGHKLVMNLSGIETVATFLGMTQSADLTRQVGYSSSREQGSDAQTAAGTSTAPYCQAGEAPAFANGMAALKQQVGDAMGTPVECEHVASIRGDTIQQTTTGLAAYDRADNTVTFTDGWHHWASTADGFVSWEGTEANPPPQTAAQPEDADAPPGQDQ